MFGYENAGVGIPKNAPKKKGILRFFELFFRKFWKILEVNMLYAVFFIPIVLALYALLYVESVTVTTLMIAVCTVVFALVIGPATTGMFKILRNYTLEKHAFILTDFKKAFTENFKKSLAMGLVDIVFFFVISAAMYVYPKLAKEYSSLIMILFVICVSMALVAVMMNFYTFLMIASADISFKNVLKNSFVLSLVALKKNLLTLLIVLVIMAAMAVLLHYLPVFVILLLFLPASVIGFIISFNCYPVIQKYVINPYYEQRGEVNPELDIPDANDEDVLFEDRGGSEKPIEKKKHKKGKTIS